MTTRPAFRFGGRLALDLTWTVRFRSVAPTELLVGPGDLDRWLVAAGFTPGDGRSDGAGLDLARALREAVDRSARRRIEGRRMAGTDVDTINDAADHAPPLPRLTRTGQVVVAAHVRSALAAVAHDAIDLLGTDHHGRLRVCEGDRCALLFVDDSRPGRRRWCSVEVCGNRANTARYRTRRSSG